MLKETSEGVLLSVRVIPGSKDDGLSGVTGDNELRVRVKAPARDGKANKRLLKVLKTVFGECEIKTGFNSKDKSILIKNKSTWDILHKITDLTE